MISPLQAYRLRMAARGAKRVEVSVPATDADLIRRVARALAGNDATAERLRLTIEQKVPRKNRLSFEEWLASLPDEEEH
jgi:hypothetical protein